MVVQSVSAVVVADLVSAVVVVEGEELAGVTSVVVVVVARWQ